jgi:dephospho-CoA kinase
MTKDEGQRTKLVVGLVGGMGSGKSRVAEEFARRGARVISGDQLGHEALRRPKVRDSVVARWGREVLDARGQIDRGKLGAIVFRDLAELRALEAILFPQIERRIGEEVAAARADSAVPLIVLDAAVLFEAGWNKVCDRVVYVNAPRDVRLARLAEQRGWGAKEVEAREQAQLPLDEKARRADVSLDNSGPVEETARQIGRLLREWGVTDTGK